MSSSLCAMTPRQRLAEVMFGRTPDHVPALADLSWHHAAHGGGRFLPTIGGLGDRLAALLDQHRATGAAIHLNCGAFYREVFPDGVAVATRVDGDRFFTELRTPLGTLTEQRDWQAASASWGIARHMIQTAADLKVVRYAYERVTHSVDWDRFRQVDAQVGDLGLPFVQAPYTGMGFLISRYAGVERTVMMAMDEPDELAATLAALNAAHERVFRLLADGPSQVLFVSDNLSSDVQSPAWFARYSAAHYQKLAAIAREHGKVLSVHIDGRLRGLLGAVASCGVDGADAVTPAPWGDLTPAQCRAEAGPRLVLSGGVPPDSFAPDVPMKTFDAQVEAWLALRHQSPALLIAPGDQLPPGGDLDRVRRMVAMARSAVFR